jgi:hypothetical protein
MSTAILCLDSGQSTYSAEHGEFGIPQEPVKPVVAISLFLMFGIRQQIWA